MNEDVPVPLRMGYLTTLHKPGHDFQARDAVAEQKTLASHCLRHLEQRKRDERSAYIAAVQVRKNAQEAKLCLPFPVERINV